VTGVNFINVLQAAASKCTDPKSAKKTVKLSVFFALLGSALAKDAHLMLMKSTPDRGHCAMIQTRFNFTNISQAAFMCADPKSVKRHV